MTRFALGSINSFGELDTRGFDLDPQDPFKRILVVRRDGKFYCYRNSCPHTGAPLNWEGDRFLSLDRVFIQCSLHGALFRIDSGYCIAGPCPGTSLSPVRLLIEDGQLIVEL